MKLRTRRRCKIEAYRYGHMWAARGAIPREQSRAENDSKIKPPTNYFSARNQCSTGGKPSTRLPPGRLVEQVLHWKWLESMQILQSQSLRTWKHWNLPKNIDSGSFSRTLDKYRLLVEWSYGHADGAELKLIGMVICGRHAGQSLQSNREQRTIQKLGALPLVEGGCAKHSRHIVISLTDNHEERDKKTLNFWMP